MPNYLFFIQGIPEMMGVVALSLAMARVPLRWGRIFFLGSLLAVSVFLVKSLPFSYGMHMIVVILLLFLFFIKTTTILPSKSLILIFTSVVTLAFIELIIHESFFYFSKVDPNAFMSDDVLWTKLGLVQAVLMNLLAILAAKLWKADQDKWKL